MNQRKARPTRAERARQKTRVPNLPRESVPAGGRRYEPVSPPERELPPVAQVTVAAPVRTGPRLPAGAIQDYSYVRRDLTRIAIISVLMLALLIGLAAVQQGTM